jgi:hypothetical protein
LVRYRLRLLLQEIDLPYGETVLGRSADANLTIEDPLVSRRHARIVVDESGGRIDDLDSRNGVRVNGVLIRGSSRLNDGDRVRLGTQDLIFCRVEQGPPRQNKTTGVLRLCANCRLPYAREMVACPNCESTEQLEEQTLQGDDPSGERGGWAMQLLVEALERALAHARIPDAERIVRRATAELDAHVAGGGAPDGKTLTLLATGAAATTAATGDPVWALWVIDAYRRVNRVPSAAVVRSLEVAASRHGREMLVPIRRLTAHIHAQAQQNAEAAGLSTADAEALARLDDLQSTIERDVGDGPATSDPDATLGVGSH